MISLLFLFFYFSVGKYSKTRNDIEGLGETKLLLWTCRERHRFSRQNKAALSQNENVPHGGKFISDEERIEQQMAWDTISHHHFNINDITRNLTRRDEAAQMSLCRGKGGGWWRGEVCFQKNWVGVYGPVSKRSTLFITRICHFFLQYFWLALKFDTPFTACFRRA